MRTGETLESRLDAVRMRGDVWTRVETAAIAYITAHGAEIVGLYDRLHAQKAGDAVSSEVEDQVAAHVETFLSGLRADDIETDYGNEPTDEADVLTGLAANAADFANDLLEGLHDKPLNLRSRSRVAPMLAALSAPDETLPWMDRLYAISGRVLANMTPEDQRAIADRAFDLHGATDTYRSTMGDDYRPEEGHVQYHNVAYREMRQKWAEAAVRSFTIAARTIAESRGILPSDYGMRITLDATVADPRTIVLQYMDHPSETSFGEPGEDGYGEYLFSHESRERSIVMTDAVDRCALPRRSSILLLDDQFAWLALLEGRDAEIREAGMDPADAPLWSYATPLILRLAMERSGNVRKDFMKNPRLGLSGSSNDPDSFTATQTGGIISVNKAILTEDLTYSSSGGSYVIEVRQDRPLPDTIVQSMPGRHVKTLVKHPYLDDDRILVRSAKQDDGFLVLGLAMPIVRLEEAPAGIDPDPIRAWRQPREQSDR